MTEVNSETTDPVLNETVKQVAKIMAEDTTETTRQYKDREKGKISGYAIDLPEITDKKGKTHTPVLITFTDVEYYDKYIEDIPKFFAPTGLDRNLLCVVRTQTGAGLEADHRNPTMTDLEFVKSKLQAH